MTNLIASLVITVSTNWSGTGPETKEVGFIQTNYSAQCVFGGKTNLFTLENRFATGVAWREKQNTITFNTNTFGRYFYGPLIITNGGLIGL